MTKFEKFKTFTIDDMAKIFIMTVTTGTGMHYYSLFDWNKFMTKEEVIEHNKQYLESEVSTNNGTENT